MSTLKRRMAKRLVAATLTCTVLALTFAQPAAAHKVGHRPAVTNQYYRLYDRQHGRRYVFPRWLQRDRDFQRWFLRNDYRYVTGYNRGGSWEELYSLYRFERRHWRNGHRRFRGKVYVAPEYFYRRRH